MQKNNAEIIPNVSTVYRQLVQITQFNPRLNQTQNNNFNSSYSKTNNNYNIEINTINNKTDYITNIQQDNRQKRHQQLMNRFKSSFQQNRQIFGINQSPKIDNFTNKIYQNQNSFNSIQKNPNLYSYQSSNQFNNTKFNKQPQTTSTKWVPPKIKYRHIEDFKQSKNQKLNIQTNYSKNQIQQKCLKQDFYATGLSNKSFQYNNREFKQNLDKQIQNQTQRKQTDNVERYQQQSYQRIMNNNKQPSKYNQKLQSYYQICRKSAKQTPSSYQNKEQNNDLKILADKFTRKAVPKVQGYNIEKALQILSFE